MKTMDRVLLVGAGLLGSLYLLHAQIATGGPDVGGNLVQSAPPDSIVQLTAEAQGLNLISPTDLPDGGTFWTLMPDGLTAPFPCAPSDPNVPVYQIADGQFIVDATGGQVTLDAEQTNRSTVTAALETLAQTVVNLINDVQEAQVTREIMAVMGLDEEVDSAPARFEAMQMSVADTNALWLEITNVANGNSYYNLHNATNFVYAILTKTNLLDASWNIEAELWPTGDQTNVMPFTLANAERDILFVRAMDWTDVDSNNDGVPDWWIWKYFGDLSENATNLDSTGTRTLGDDFANGIDPNVIQFTLEAANDYVNLPFANVQMNLTAGNPSFYALLVNGQTGTNWLPFVSTNLTVTLGSTDGVYNVSVGLRGLPDDATQTWDSYRFTLDRSAPKIYLTNPLVGSNVVTKPYLQLQGFADKPLASLAYNISNALGVATNLDVFVTEQSFDTNQFDFTTNYFQAFDVPLATNGNALTLRVTDRAGNTTTTNFNVVLDYAHATNPPVIKLLWPTNGMAVSGSSCTIRGTMSDETGSIVAQITDGNGNTNTVAGLVERNNMFWIENVPLSGTNQISLQATDAAGNVTTTNFTVLPSDIVLTIDSTPTGDGLYQASGTVSGTVSDPTATVTVNGVTVTNDYWTDGLTWYWTADNVPIYGQGTATFAAVATPAGQNSSGGQALQRAQAMNNNSPPTPPVNVGMNVEMSAYILMTSYHSTEIQEYSEPSYSSFYRVKKNMAAQPVPLANGEWGMTDGRTNDTYWSENYYGWFDYGHTRYQWSTPAASTDTYHYDDASGGSYDGPIIWPGDSLGNAVVQAMPHGDQTWGCATCGPTYMWAMVYHYFGDGVLPPWNFGSDSSFTMGVTAKTEQKLFTGGKATVAQQNLFMLNASATEILRPPSASWWGVPVKAVDPTKTLVAGKTLGADNNRWLMLPDSPVGLDVTVKAPGIHHYDARVTQQKYKMAVQANGHTLRENEVVSEAKHAIGEKINFSPVFVPALPEEPQKNPIQWTLDGTYINAFKVTTSASSPPMDGLEDLYDSARGLTDFRVDAARLKLENTFVWWQTGSTTGFETEKIGVGMGLTFANGQYVVVTAKGQIGMHQPTVSFDADSYQAGVVHGRMLGIYPANVLQCRVGSYDDESDRIALSARSSSLRQGRFAVTQLIIRDSTVPTDTFTDWRLDNSFPYTDDPDWYHSLTTTNQGTAYLQFSDGPSCIVGGYTWDKFDQYFMYRPTTTGTSGQPGTFLSGSIWVTLGKANWEWKGKIKYFYLTDSWGWDSAPYCIHSQSIQPSTQIPEWENTKLNF